MLYLIDQENKQYQKLASIRDKAEFQRLKRLGIAVYALSTPPLAAYTENPALLDKYSEYAK